MMHIDQSEQGKLKIGNYIFWGQRWDMALLAK
jgi:hypothetical protein